MQNLPLNEDALIRTLKEVEVPAAPPELITRLSTAQSRNRALLWAVPATAATMLTLALIPTLLVPPTFSLAQVARAQSEHQQYTITNRRIMNRGTEGFEIKTYRDGGLWRRGNFYGLPDKSVGIYHMPPYHNFVTFDDPRPAPEEEFRVDKLLREGEKPKVERDVKWKGQRVHRFTIKTTYRAGKVQTFGQEIIVDPQTKLPIYMKIMRDSGQWGDEWFYEFKKPDPKVFAYKIPDGAKQFDNVQIRKDIDGRFASGPVGGLLIDQSHRTTLFLDASYPPQSQTYKLKVDGVAEPLSGRFDELILAMRVRPGTPIQPGIEVGGKRWRMISFFLPVPKWNQTDRLYAKPHVSGTLTVGSKKINLKDVPVFSCGDSLQLLRRYVGE